MSDFPLQLVDPLLELEDALLEAVQLQALTLCCAVQVAAGIWTKLLRTPAPAF